MQTKIIIAMHKPYKTPAESVYLPLQVGAEGKDSILGLVCDNTGENISAKNPTYCELTGLYWAWYITVDTLQERAALIGRRMQTT